MPRLPALDIKSQSNLSPHVVILGAGASLAAFPRGDKHGRRLPVMRNFVEVLGLEDLVVRAGMPATQNFELVYDAIYANHALASVRAEIETRIRDYFAAMQIPDEVTLYDELLASLRQKDLVASFNWDPLLLQAYRRSTVRGHAPRLAFLHGNVGAGYCEPHKVKGNAGSSCRHCGEVLTPSPLLFPIKDKRYRDHPFLAQEWHDLEADLKHAFILTIFGYSAPTSDVAARAILYDTWVNNETRELAEVEIVDIRPRRELMRSWQAFFVRQHFGSSRRLCRTIALRNPRRSCEALASAILQNDPWPQHPLPRFTKVASLSRAVEPLVKEEEGLKQQKTPFSRHTGFAR